MTKLVDIVLEQSRHAVRFIIAIAGPPGAGKSTLSEALARELPQSAILPVDGFHYDNLHLDQLGRRAYKGAPDTFDCRGLEILLRRIRAREVETIVPIFDRTRDVACAGAKAIPQEAKHIIVEGNYLLVKRGDWARMREFLDFTIFISTPREELERRLIGRWVEFGHDMAYARQRALSNDLPNADYVCKNSETADIVWQQ
ncbi:AAA family ATPase [Aminobacter sp. Piv2-1]|uniref:AAA family ATPase n=1 Tax=Aminobacter sp. Piv2-1 TaxID=3031122 RepID=UPI0030AEC75F